MDFLTVDIVVYFYIIFTSFCNRIEKQQNGDRPRQRDDDDMSHVKMLKVKKLCFRFEAVTDYHTECILHIF